MLVLSCADLDGIGYHERCHFLFQRCDLIYRDCRLWKYWSDLVREKSVDDAHIGYPTEDISMETYVVFGYVETTLNQDLPLESAPIVWTRRRMSVTGRQGSIGTSTFNEVIALGYSRK